MKEKFVKEDMSVEEVAEECGEPPWRISKWKRRHDFEGTMIECEDCGEMFESLSTHHGLSDCGE